MIKERDGNAACGRWPLPVYADLLYDFHEGDLKDEKDQHAFLYPGLCPAAGYMRLRDCGKRAAERCSLSDGHPGGR